MTELDAPIKEVTVYADRALVTRRGSCTLEAGEHELRVNNLPQFLHESLRAGGNGPEGTRIQNVEVTTAYYSRPPEAELQALQTELEALQRKQRLLEARRDALNDRREWLRSLGEQSKDFARGLAQGQMKAQDCADFFGFMANQSLQDAEASLDLDQQVQQAQNEVSARQRELTRRQGNPSPDRLAAIVNVTLTQGGVFELEFSYLIMNASWYPQYDVRVQVETAGSEGQVELTYVGIVKQQTGENWTNVSLALSTARPSLASILPELDPWYLDVYAPPKPIVSYQEMNMPVFASRGAAPMAAPMAAGFAMGEDAPIPVPVMAEVSTATVEQTGASLLFRIGRSVDIPSDYEPHKTTIARDDLPCSFDYVSAPVIEENAHRRATITNSGARILLKGEASIFLDGEYVGTTELKQTAPGEEFKIFLGIDDGIKVKRELIERAVDKGNLLQGGVRRITYAYRIEVHNYTSGPRKLIVRDRLPVSQHERIKVKVLQLQPTPGERSRLELLTWNFTLAADASQQIEYRFVVEHPQDLTVARLP